MIVFLGFDPGLYLGLYLGPSLDLYLGHGLYHDHDLYMEKKQKLSLMH